MKSNETSALRRTDLARELYGNDSLSVIKRRCEYKTGDDCVLTLEEAQITDQAAADKFLKPIGRYITIGYERLLSLMTLRESLTLSRIITDELLYLLPSYTNGVAVIGMGNREMTTDSLGVRCAEMIKPTRANGKKGISIVIPGVEASTGISAIELISSVIETVKPSAVIAIDSLAAREPESLGTTVQLCDSGITPGSGLGKRNIALNHETLGVPVLSIGVPTVISAKHLFTENDDFYVGLIDSDAVIESAARIIAVAIEKAFS